MTQTCAMKELQHVCRLKNTCASKQHKTGSRPVTSSTTSDLSQELAGYDMYVMRAAYVSPCEHGARGLQVLLLAVLGHPQYGSVQGHCAWLRVPRSRERGNQRGVAALRSPAVAGGIPGARRRAAVITAKRVPKPGFPPGLLSRAREMAGACKGTKSQEQRWPGWTLGGRASCQGRATSRC